MAKSDKLFEAVLARPDDGKALLVYADALEEAGDPRGQFIQLQIQAEAAEVGPTRDKLQKAAGKIEKAHRKAWLVELPMIRQATFRRGLVDTVVATAEPFLAQADKLFAQAPVRGLKLTVFQQKKHLARLAAVLAKWPLRELDLSRCQLDAAQLQTLFAKANLSQLETLKLIDNPIEEEGARLLAKLPFKKLVGLEIGGSDSQAPGDDAASAIAGAPALQKLTRLELSYFGAGPKAAEVLSRSAMCGTLTCLNLQSNPIGDAGLTALAKSPRLRSLRTLNLGHCQATDKGVRDLLNAPWIDGLKTQPGDLPWRLTLWQVKASAKTRTELEARLGPQVVAW